MTRYREKPLAPGMSNTRHGVLGFAFGLAIITYLDRICISAAAPYIMRDLGLTVLEMSLVFSAFTLAYSLFEVPTGWMGDVMGPRRVLTRVVLWWSGFTMLTGAAWNYLSLLVIRFLFGAGEAGAFPNVSRSFSRWFPLRERGKANGILFLGSRLGGALAPILALLLIRNWGWRVSFAVFGAIGIFWALAWYRWYRDEPSEHPAVNSHELAWIQQDSPNADSKTHASAIPWRQILTSSNLLAICGMYFAFGYGLYFYFTWLPTYLVQVLKFSDLAAGILAGLPFLLAGGADLLGGWLTDRLAIAFNLRIARCWLGFSSFAGSATLLFASTQANDRWTKAILIALALASADLALSACWAVCLDVGRAYAGIVTGCMNTFGNLGGFLGPMVLGYAVERWNSWTLPFYVSAAVYAAGALLWLAVRPEEQLTPG
jgi:ACS family glucarate transporter-like MFS transporter